MDKIPDEVFAILTAKQKEVYLLRMEGMTFAEIGRKLGKSVNAVRENYRGVERRTRGYTAYQRAEMRNNEVVDFPMTRGELKVVCDGLRKLQEDATRNIHPSAQKDWRDRLPYSALVVKQLLERAEKEIYGFSFPTVID